MLQFPSRNVTPHGLFRYTQPETERFFRTNTWKGMVSEVRKHRDGINSGTSRHNISLDLSEGWEARLEEVVCAQYGELCVDPDNPKPLSSYKDRLGRELWREMHDYAIRYPIKPSQINLTEASEWLLGWERRIPNFEGLCSCRREYEEIKASLPPDFSSREKFYLWTAQVHNAVNRKADHQEWSVPQDILAQLTDS